MKILSRLANMGIRYASIEPSDMTALALDAGITTYDAAYLWLAVFSDAVLVTLDADFARAAGKVLPMGRVLPQKH